MAGEPRQPSRSRPVSKPSSEESADVTLPGADPTMAPITANTPLPPLNLASGAGAGSAAPQPPPQSWTPPDEGPTLPPQPLSSFQPPAPGPQAPQQSARGAAGSAIPSTWAAYTTFALVYTSLILLAAMAIAYAVITKSGALLAWVVVIIVIVNIAYPLIVFSIARPGSVQSMRLPFMSPRRGP